MVKIRSTCCCCGCCCYDCYCCCPIIQLNKKYPTKTKIKQRQTLFDFQIINLNILDCSGGQSSANTKWQNSWEELPIQTQDTYNHCHCCGHCNSCYYGYCLCSAWWTGEHYTMSYLFMYWYLDYYKEISYGNNICYMKCMI